MFFCKFESQALRNIKAALISSIDHEETVSTIKKSDEEAERHHFKIRDEDDEFIVHQNTSNSLPYKIFLEISSKAILDAEKSGDSSQPNDYFDEKGKEGVLYKLLDLKIRFLPLWSMIEFKQFSTIRPTNGIIENHHNELKNGELMGQLDRSISNYIQIRQQILDDKIKSGANKKYLDVIQRGKPRRRKKAKARKYFKLVFTFYFIMPSHFIRSALKMPKICQMSKARNSTAKRKSTFHHLNQAKNLLILIENSRKISLRLEIRNRHLMLCLMFRLQQKKFVQKTV